MAPQFCKCKVLCGGEDPFCSTIRNNTRIEEALYNPFSLPSLGLFSTANSPFPFDRTAMLWTCVPFFFSWSINENFIFFLLALESSSSPFTSSNEISCLTWGSLLCFQAVMSGKLWIQPSTKETREVFAPLALPITIAQVLTLIPVWFPKKRFW